MYVYKEYKLIESLGEAGRITTARIKFITMSSLKIDDYVH